MRRPRAVVGVLLACLLCVAGLGYAQIFSGFYGSAPPRYPTADTFKGSFNFCRAIFSRNRREKRGWDTDYPGAENNFSVRLAELTKTRISRNAKGEPDYVTVRLTDPAMFQCPFLLMEDAGTAVFSEPEVSQLREYLLKGGFIFASDYWGEYSREQLDNQLARVLPPEQYPVVSIPMDHPVWHTQFDVKRVPQMTSIQSWRRTGGAYERGVPATGSVEPRGIADAHGRLMVVMLHDTDIPDGWEREGEEKEYFLKYSPDSYAVGIDVALYALTH